MSSSLPSWNQQQNRPIYVPKRQRQARQQQQDPPVSASRKRQLRQQQDEIDRRSGAYFRSDDYIDDDTAIAKETRQLSNEPHLADHPQQPEGGEPQQRRYHQKLEDFMDDQDHNDWGGPLKVRREYGEATGGSGTIEKNWSSLKTSRLEENDTWAEPIHKSLSSMTAEIHHDDSIGHRLLKQLGWREGPKNSSSMNTTSASYTVYVPTDEREATGGPDDDDEECFVHLSARRLRKIVRNEAGLNNSQRPTTQWKGSFGLGYVGLSKLTNETTHSAKVSSVYKVSNLLSRRDDGDPRSSVNRRMVQHEGDSAHDDFVGTRSTAGFALHDDDDDAYDDNYNMNSTLADQRSSETVLGWNLITASSSSGKKSEQSTALTIPNQDVNIDSSTQQLTVYDGDRQTQLKRKIMEAGYNAEAYDHVDSDSDDNNGRQRSAKLQSSSSQLSNTIAGVLSTWAASTTDAKESTALQPDDKSPAHVPGFVKATQTPALFGTFFRGPDVPSSWMDPPHVFGPNEHPSIFQALAHTDQLQAKTNRREAIYAEALESVRIKPTTTTTATMTASTAKSSIDGAWERSGILLPPTPPLSVLPVETMSLRQNTDHQLLPPLPPLPSLPPPPPPPNLPRDLANNMGLPPPLLNLPRPPLPTTSLLPPPAIPPSFAPPPPLHGRSQQLPLRSSDSGTSSSTSSGSAPSKNVFAGVRAAMQSRFTASQSTGSERQEVNSNAAPSSNEQSRQEHNHHPASDVWMITRTTYSFVPEPLLCKRFGVKPSMLTTPTMGDSRSREEVYFYDEIMREAQTVVAANTTTTSTAAETTLQAANETGDKVSASKQNRNADVESFLTELAASNTANNDKSTTASHPSMTILHSIFEPDSDKGDSDDIDDNEDIDDKTLPRRKAATEQDVSLSTVLQRNPMNDDEIVPPIATKNRSIHDDDNDDDDNAMVTEAGAHSALVVYDASTATSQIKSESHKRRRRDDGHHKKHKKRRDKDAKNEKKDRKRHKSKRKHSRSSSMSSSSSRSFLDDDEAIDDDNDSSKYHRKKKKKTKKTKREDG